MIAPEPTAGEQHALPEIVRVRCPHREGLAYRKGDTLSLLPCDCNDPSEVIDVVGVDVDLWDDLRRQRNEWRRVAVSRRAAAPADCVGAGGCVRDDGDACADTPCNAGEVEASHPDPTAGERACRYPCDCGQFHDEHCACMDGHAPAAPETDVSARETLADLIWNNTDEPMWSAMVLAEQFLGSGWLAAREAAARAEGAAAVRDDIRARRREFRRLNAHQEYLNALDDAYGLAANRAREAR